MCSVFFIHIIVPYVYGSLVCTPDDAPVDIAVVRP